MTSVRQTAEWTWKRNDTNSPILYDLFGQDQATNPLDITGATVRFKMRAVNGTVLKIDGVGAIVSVTLPARVSYTPTALDTDTSGMFIAEWELTLAGGEVETFPNGRNIAVLIFPDLP